MHAFDVLGDPVRRRIMELLADGERASGEIVRVIADEFGLTQPAVSYQLRILRVNGFATVRPEAQRRIYALDPGSIAEIEAWLAPFRRNREHALGALESEVARANARSQSGRTECGIEGSRGGPSYRATEGDCVRGGRSRCI